MLRIGQLKLPPDHSKQDLFEKTAKTLHIPTKDILDLTIYKQSIDARKKPDIYYVYTVDVNVKDEPLLLKRKHTSNVSVISQKKYQFPTSCEKTPESSPIIIEMGPAGLFCAYMLAKHGYKPIVFERGASVEERLQDIEDFWNTGILKPESNVQFGEGGAGTFSDGKLNTMTKDREGRNRKMLEIFVENGAPEDILFINKPHIGTDILVSVVKNMREKIIAWGGEIHFHSQFCDFEMVNNQLISVTIQTPKGTKKVPAKVAVLAIGHSARDTFQMLYQKQVPMVAKSFAVGVRVEHLQSMINASQYGKDCSYKLPAADYKLTANLENGRGIYSFCMCPGGYVVNASSEEGHLAINGMSYHARDGKNANSAIIVTVSPEDYGKDHPLAGIHFQRQLEEKAYEAGQGKIPVQRYDDFCACRISNQLGRIIPQTKGNWTFGDVRNIFPESIQESIEQGIALFDKQIKGYAADDTLLSGVESRTSSPVRILRDEEYESAVKGIYPCGEGAGYAGGITSAAIDGIKVAEKVASCHYLFTKK